MEMHLDCAGLNSNKATGCIYSVHNQFDNNLYLNVIIHLPNAESFSFTYNYINYYLIYTSSIGLCFSKFGRTNRLVFSDDSYRAY